MSISGQSISKPPEAGYLPFVDGLRAIAILAVVAFHAGMPGFTGGFVGVDIFFVISGYLIIGQIRDQLAAGNFSIMSFYSRRTIRIIPAYLVMLVAVSVAGPLLLLTPDSYEGFAKSSVLAPLMATNILFFLEQGYFDLSALEKPLLHTWTLSVEEQFYWITPILLIGIYFIFGKKFDWRALLTALILLLLSLAACIAWTAQTGRNPAFYLPHLRAWEFLAGGLVVPYTIGILQRTPTIVKEIVAIVGMALMLFGIFWLTDEMAFPSWRAIFPVGGAMLVLLAGRARPQNIVAKLLSLKPLTAIGLVSFGWYLWHWPIISFLHIGFGPDVSLGAQLVGGGLGGLGLACLSYRYVEQPIRNWRRGPGSEQTSLRVVLIGIASVFLVSAIGGGASLGGYLATAARVDARYGIDGGGEKLDCHVLTGSTIQDHCLVVPFALMIGDSHAGAVAGSFARHLAGEGLTLASMARGGCDPLWFSVSPEDLDPAVRCANLIPPFRRVLEEAEPPRFVILVSTWAYQDISFERFAALFSLFDTSKTRIFVIGPVPFFERPGIECVLRADRYGAESETCNSNRVTLDEMRATTIGNLKAALVAYPDVVYMDPIDLFCDEERCQLIEQDNLYYEDTNHLTVLGADRLYAGFRPLLLEAGLIEE